MARDLKTQLAEHYLAAVRGAKHPPYCDLSIADSYARFCAEIAGRRFRDPRGETVVIHQENFPKLLGMKRADPATGQVIVDPHTGKPAKAKASKVLAQLKSGTFQDAAHRVERGRIRTLFWIPDVITDPHSIHPNAHRVVAGDEVYVKKYLKLGYEVKIVVMGPAGDGRVIITSFLTDESDLAKYVGMPPVWTKK
jgi:hypothetical protein